MADNNKNPFPLAEIIITAAIAVSLVSVAIPLYASYVRDFRRSATEESSNIIARTSSAPPDFDVADAGVVAPVIPEAMEFAFPGVVVSHAGVGQMAP